MNVETYGGETFLSEEVAISILQEMRMAFGRCNLVLLIFLLFLFYCECFSCAKDKMLLK
jgi:hypothetical protein